MVAEIVPVLQRVRGILPAHHQNVVKTNCETLEPILATCPPHLRTADADTSTQTRRSLPPVVLELLHSSPFRFTPACDRASSFLLCRLSLSLSFRCSGFDVLCSLAQLIHAIKDVMCFRHSSTPSALSALTTARQRRLQDQTTQHQSLYRDSATIDEFLTTQVLWTQMTCLFQAHGLNENSLCTNVHQV